MSWRAYYEKRLVSPEAAIGGVKSGDLVVFTQGLEPFDLGLALTAHVTTLKDVTISVRTPGRDFGWYDPGWENIVNIEVNHAN